MGGGAASGGAAAGAGAGTARTAAAWLDEAYTQAALTARMQRYAHGAVPSGDSGGGDAGVGGAHTGTRASPARPSAFGLPGSGSTGEAPWPRALPRLGTGRRWHSTTAPAAAGAGARTGGTGGQGGQGGAAYPGGADLTHVDGAGEATMVDVTGKPVSDRSATAVGKVLLDAKTYELVAQNLLKKGDVLSVAKLAGIMGAKHTSTLIPLCHNVVINKVAVTLTLSEHERAVDIAATATCSGKTGVEMEALVAVSVAGLTVYDMCKAVSYDIVLGDIHLMAKSGGVRGEYARTPGPGPGRTD